MFIDPLHEIWLERTIDHKDLSNVQEFMQKVLPKAPQHIQDEVATTLAGIEEAKAMGPLPNVPATVLSSTRLWMNVPTTDLMLLQISIHNSLAKQIPEARHILTNKSGHTIQDDEPELVIESIRQVWEKRKGKKHRT